MKRISFGFLALSAVMSAAMQAGAVDYVIEGRIDGCDSLMLYAHDYNTRTNIDSAVVVDGSLRIVGSYDDNALVRIEGGRYFSNCVIDTLAVGWLGTEQTAARLLRGIRSNRRGAGEILP